MLKCNPEGDYPQVDKSAYIDSTAVIVGKVNIGKNVFVGPTAVIRADEPGSTIVIGDNCNVQDRAIIHALENTSVLIEENTSLAHGCIIHGPCKIGKNCFIGFGSVVFKSEIEQDVVIKHLVIVEGVSIPARKIVESGKVIRGEEDARKSRSVGKKSRDFIKKVFKTNLGLVKGYKKIKHKKENKAKTDK